MKKRRMKGGRIRRIVLLILFNVAVIAWPAWREFGKRSSGDPFPDMDRTALLFLAGAVGCLLLAIAAGTLKYLLMMYAAGERASVRVAFETTVLGKYYDFITPSGIGGEPFQIWWLRRNSYSAGSAGAMPIIGFVTVQAGFIIPALLIMCVWRPEDLEAVRVSAYIGMFMLLIVPGVLLWFSAAPAFALRVITAVVRFGGRLRVVKNPEQVCGDIVATLSEYHNSFRILAGHHGLTFTLILLSSVFRFSLLSIPFFVLRAMWSEGAFGMVLALSVYLQAAVTLVPTPGNAGAAEGLFYVIYSAGGATGVFWAMLIWRLLVFYFFLAAGALIQGIRAAQGFDALPSDDQGYGSGTDEQEDTP